MGSRLGLIASNLAPRQLLAAPFSPMAAPRSHIRGSTAELAETAEGICTAETAETAEDQKRSD